MLTFRYIALYMCKFTVIIGIQIYTFQQFDCTHVEVESY